MADAITVAVRRGGVVESRHRVHAVAVRDGTVVAEAGDGGLVTFMRSAAKPLQALPLARALPDLDDRLLAIACASHRAEPEQLGAVRTLLERAPAAPDELECGAEGDPADALNHNCSGKHAGFLALCRANGWDSRGYRLADHPCQRAMRDEVAFATGLSPEELEPATDGCGVVTYALPLERMAFAFARLRELEGGDRVVAAMRAHPRLIRGAGAPDTVLMETLDGWVAKGGAEGLLCAVGPDNTGVAIKVEDGSSRAVGPGAAEFLRRLGHLLEAVEVSAVDNSRGEVVGEIRAE